jgi:hypothetical protein
MENLNGSREILDFVACIGEKSNIESCRLQQKRGRKKV